MAEQQTSLFGDELIGRATSKDLVLHEQPGRPLTKAQRSFNRLVAKVDKLRVKLDQETAPRPAGGRKGDNRTPYVSCSLSTRRLPSVPV